VEVTPSSGMINRGNDRKEISIVLESIGDSYRDLLVLLKLTISLEQDSLNEDELKASVEKVLASEGAIKVHVISHVFDSYFGRQSTYFHIYGATKFNSTEADAVVQLLTSESLIPSNLSAAMHIQDIDVDAQVLSHNLWITLATRAKVPEIFPCEFVSEPVNSVRESVQRTQINCLAPELPKVLVGTLSLEVVGLSYYEAGGVSTNLGPFTQDWEFLAPPDPSIDLDSILIDGEQRDPSWVKKSSSSTQQGTRISLEVANLVAKYESSFDDLHVWFNESRSSTSMLQFTTVGMTTAVSFSLDVGGMDQGFYSLVIHVMKEGKILTDTQGQDIVLRLPDIEMQTAAQLLS
jgi:hypothetical protein